MLHPPLACSRAAVTMAWMGTASRKLTKRDPSDISDSTAAKLDALVATFNYLSLSRKTVTLLTTISKAK